MVAYIKKPTLRFGFSEFQNSVKIPFSEIFFLMI